MKAHRHHTLIMLDDPRVPYVEHTCACWLPMNGRDGVIDISRRRKAPLVPYAWNGLGKNPQPCGWDYGKRIREPEED